MITKEEWRDGSFRDKPDFKTQEMYYKSVGEFVKAYGEPTKEDMIVARSGHRKEFLTGKFGCSWNPNLNNTRNIAKLYLADTIYVMVVPKGTMAVHYNIGEGEGKCALEEEYVFDMAGLGLNKKGKVGIIAEHTGEWDISSDYETDTDFERWRLKQPVPKCLIGIDRPLLNKFFASISL